jgi:hypothetical protein
MTSPSPPHGYRTPDVEAERDALRSERDELRTENRRLRAVIDDLTRPLPTYVPHGSPCPVCRHARADALSAFRRYVPPRKRTWWRSGHVGHFRAMCLHCRHEFDEGLPSRWIGGGT